MRFGRRYGAGKCCKCRCDSVPFMGNGDTKIIRGIAGHDMMRRHLAEMGFVTGEPITMISQYGGNVILQVKGFRVALDKKLARRIIV